VNETGPPTDLGPPTAYLALADGTPVYDRTGARIGVVDHVLSDETVDIFHGLIVHTVPLPGKHLYADADQIAELRERGVLLSVERDGLHVPEEPRPAGNAPGRSVESPLQTGLRRAWDWLSQPR
jgi:hypothetical protein